MEFPKRFVRIYQQSEVIFEEHSLGREMFIISAGHVKLSTKATGRELVLATLGPGDFFGEMALVDDGPRSATATVLEANTRLVALDQAKFLYLVGQQPPFALTIMHGLCQRIRERWALYTRLSEKSCGGDEIIKGEGRNCSPHKVLKARRVGDIAD